VRQYGFSSCLPRSIRVREGGQARRITKQRALIKSLTAQALKGDARGNERTACDKHGPDQMRQTLLQLLRCSRRQECCHSAPAPIGQRQTRCQRVGNQSDYSQNEYAGSEPTPVRLNHTQENDGPASDDVPPSREVVGWLVTLILSTSP